jgi:hypothetical protein
MAVGPSLAFRRILVLQRHRAAVDISKLSVHDHTDSARFVVKRARGV